MNLPSSHSLPFSQNAAQTLTWPESAALFEALPHACLMVSQAKVILAANAAYCSLRMCQPGDLVGLPFMSLFATVAKHDQAELQASLDAVLATGAQDGRRVKGYGPPASSGNSPSSGEKRWRTLNIPLLGPDGRIAVVLHFVEDTSQGVEREDSQASLSAMDRMRKANVRISARISDNVRLEAERVKIGEEVLASEERLRTLANNLPGVVYRRIVQPNGKAHDIYVSNGVQEHLGVPAQLLMSGELSLLDLVHPEDRERNQEAMRNAAAKGVALTIDVRKIARRGNRIRWWRVHARPTALPNGVVQWDGIGIDITDQKLAEQQLVHAIKMEAVGQLTGGIAHDFNNLLTIILGNAEALVGKLARQPDLRPLAVLTQMAAERGAELTNRLLMFARHQPREAKSIDVNNLISMMDPLLRNALGKEVEIEIIRQSGQWKALTDPEQLQAALLNLAMNAREAMPGGGRLLIETSNFEADATDDRESGGIRPGHYVMLAVSDNGCGMTKKTLERAFDPFFTTKAVGMGSGLGLSMVSDFMKQSGGHVSIHSEVDQGTRVKLYLPRSTADAAGFVAMDGSKKEPAGTGTVLLVEDDGMVRNHVRTMLEELGYQTLAAGNGPEALEILDQGLAPDLLFTDVVLPGGLSGKVLADLATARRPGLPVLFMSGDTQNAILHNGPLDPGVDLLRKPFRRYDLALKLREALDRSRAASDKDPWFSH